MSGQTIVWTFLTIVHFGVNDDREKLRMTQRWKIIFVLLMSLLVFGCKTATEPEIQDDKIDSLPSWSSNGATIAFTGYYNGMQGIYLVDATGKNMHLVVVGIVQGCRG